MDGVINRDMYSILNKVDATPLSRREIEIKRDSSMEYVTHSAYICVATHRNNIKSNGVQSYLKARNRFAWCPRKSYKHY